MQSLKIQFIMLLLTQLSHCRELPLSLEMKPKGGVWFYEGY